MCEHTLAILYLLTQYTKKIYSPLMTEILFFECWFRYSIFSSHLGRIRIIALQTFFRTKIFIWSLCEFLDIDYLLAMSKKLNFGSLLNILVCTKYAIIWYLQFSLKLTAKMHSSNFGFVNRSSTRWRICILHHYVYIYRNS